MHAHVIGSEQREAGIGTARAVGIDRVLGELAEGRGVAAKAVGVVGVAGDAGHDLGIARLHCARRAPQRHDTTRAAHGDVVEPARREAKVLHEADGRVREEEEPRNARAIDLRFLQTGTLEQRPERLGDEPVRAPDGVTYVGNRHRDGDRHALVALPAHCASRRFRPRRSMQEPSSRSRRARSRSSLR